MGLPFLTQAFAGIGGSIKQRPEDFFVQELPLYEPSGDGAHTYCEIQKLGLTTFDVIHRIAAALGVSSRDIGYAGMKDAYAITRQTLSIPGADEQQLMALRIPDITVLRAAKHGNKLRLGHLRGNRFAIKIRDVNATDVVKLPPVIQLLEQRGMPNYFGEQRFGRRGDNARLGAALLRDQPQDLLGLLLGTPNPDTDPPDAVRARTLFEEGKLEESLRAFPRGHGLESSVLSRLIKTGSAEAAFRSIDQKIRRLWLSALQSAVFNDVVAARIESLDRLMAGDLACKHGHGAVFRVEDASAEQARCDAFEISPSGPMVGHKMTLPDAEPLRIEQDIFEKHGLSPADFRQEGRDRAKGERRPLRVKPEDVRIAGGADEHGPHITVAFSLAAGSYATVFLRELMKPDADVPG